jgi:hypothetical protein
MKASIHAAFVEVITYICTGCVTDVDYYEMSINNFTFLGADFLAFLIGTHGLSISIRPA